MNSSQNFDAATYDTIGNVDKSSWNSVLAHSECGSIYHSYEWIRAIEKGLNLQGKHVVVQHSGNFIGIFPNFVSGMRLPGDVERRLPERVLNLFSELNSATPGFGGPVVRGDEKSALEECFEEITDQLGRRMVSHYIRSPNIHYIRYNDYFESLGYKPRLSHCRFVIDLHQDFDALLNSMHKDRRYTLRKAKEMDATVSIEPDNLLHDLIPDFYTDYQKTMERVRSNPYPMSMFTSIVDTLSDSVLLVSAEVDGNIVGRHFYVIDDQNNEIHHEFTAVRKQNFKYYPSELIHEHIIKWGMEHNYETYDFGPTPSNFEDGLFKYKEQFGGASVPILVWERGTSPLWTLYKFARKAYRRSARGQT